MQKDREDEYYQKWHERNDRLSRLQIWTRSKVRLESGYPKPINWIAYFVRDNDCIPSIEEDIDQMKSPYHIVQVVFKLTQNFCTFLKSVDTLDGLRDLEKDLRDYEQNLECSVAGYWEDLLAVVQYKINNCNS